MFEQVKMAELLCTRLCHDLTGPIGAVNNGAEFLKEEGFDMQNQAVDLIVTSSHEAVTRLQFFRMAYGRMSDQGEVSLSEKKELVEAFFAGSKITVDWPDSQTDAAGVSLSNKMSRLVLNMIIIASGALIKGGTLSIRVSKDDHSKTVKVTAKGAAVKWDKEAEQALLQQVAHEALTPKTVQPYFTGQCARELHVTLTHQADAETFDLTAVKPME